MIPKTADGRVLFAIPWQKHLIVGTTDVPVQEIDPEPQPTLEEIGFIVETARGVLGEAIGESDITQTFAGLRPLVARGTAGATKTLSREHAIVIEHGNLVTITGGKWTTYRRMAFDALEQARARGLLSTGPCITEALPIDVDPGLEAVCRAAGESGQVDPEALLAYRELARRHEQARSVDDVLFRRLRVGLTDRRAAEALRTSLAF